MRRCILSFTASLLCVLLAAAMVRWTAACGNYGTVVLDHWADGAISPDQRVASQSIAKLRNLGPTGLDALVERHASLLGDAAEDPNHDSTDRQAARDRLIAAMEQVAAQRDCRASRLYWYTDLEKAKAASKAQNKPILSLRMMGKLTDEYSCANSRFFRTTLYANSEIARLLREKFVLHWESVRPVPKVSIDFGDGRKLQRTLTGNSIHYVLASDGRVIDALPGLYSAKVFTAVLTDADVFFHDVAGAKDEARDELFARHYRDRMSMIESNWASDLRRIGVELASTNSSQPPAQASAAPAPAQPNGNPPNAAQAAIRAVGKRVVEMPIIGQLQLAQPVMPAADDMKVATTEELWPKIAALHYDDAELDAASRALIASKNPTAGRAAEAAITKLRVESPLVRVFRNLQQSIAVDTVRNEYLFRREILKWLADDAAQAGNVFALNERVYAELFLTPRSDPWLGLLPADAYSALDNNGVVSTASQTSAAFVGATQ